MPSWRTRPRRPCRWAWSRKIRPRTVSRWVESDGHGTAELLAGLDDPRIRTFTGPGRGVCSARNVALDAAAGDLVAYIDDDNRMHPEWLRSVVWAFEQHPETEVLYGAFVIDDLRRAQRAAIDSETDPIHMLELGIRASMRWSAEHRDVQKLFQFAATEERFAPALRRGGEVAANDVIRIIKQGIDDGRIRERRGVPQRLAFSDVAEQPSHDFARSRLGQVGGKNHVVGPRDRADFLFTLPDDSRIAAELLHPRAVRQYDDRVASGSHVILRRDGSPEQRLDTKDVEVRAGYEFDIDVLAPFASAEHDGRCGASRGDSFEDVVSRSELAEHGE